MYYYSRSQNCCPGNFTLVYIFDLLYDNLDPISSKYLLREHQGVRPTPSPQPAAEKRQVFFSQNKKCSKTKEYAKIFCEVFARFSVKNFFPKFFCRHIKVVFKNMSLWGLKVHEILYILNVWWGSYNVSEWIFDI